MNDMKIESLKARLRSSFDQDGRNWVDIVKTSDEFIEDKEVALSALILHQDLYPRWPKNRVIRHLFAEMVTKYFAGKDYNHNEVQVRSAAFTRRVKDPRGRLDDSYRQALCASSGSWCLNPESWSVYPGRREVGGYNRVELKPWEEGFEMLLTMFRPYHPKVVNPDFDSAYGIARYLEKRAANVFTRIEERAFSLPHTDAITRLRQPSLWELETDSVPV